MGDRATIAFTNQEFAVPCARLYVHWDGSEVSQLMAEFFAWNEDRFGTDTRYGDMPYLATRFVAWWTLLRDRSYGGWDGLGMGIDYRADEGREWEVISEPYGRPRVIAPDSGEDDPDSYIEGEIVTRELDATRYPRHALPSHPGGF